jgi:hypothetical protein
MRLDLLKLCLCLRARSVGGPLFGSQWCANGFAECMLDMEHVWRVMRAERMRDIGHKTRGFVTGGLPPRTVERLQGRCHEGIPDTLIAGLGELFQDNAVAHGLDSHQAKSARAGFGLGHRDGFARHIFGHAGGFGLAVVDDGWFNLAVDLLLSAVGGGDESVQSREVEEKTDQTNATSAHLDTDQMEGQNEPREEGQPRTTLKELSHFGTDIEGGMP